VDPVATQPRAATAASSAGAAEERYELVEQLGAGAMGTVWRARDRALARDVAVKLLHDRFLSAAHQQGLAAEAQAMARLSHPNVVAVYDVGVRDGRTFVAMELVRGQPLSAWLTTPRPWPEVVRVFRAVGEGLAAAHASGLIHRDVKPSNILLGDDGRPRLADFGVAHASRVEGVVSTTTTDTAGPIGSPAYMAPERLIGDAAGARGDQFGFCAAFYEALHGRRPFVAGTASELVGLIRRGPPPPVRPVPGWLHDVIARGLAADPAERFASMEELLGALRRGARSRAKVAMLAAAVVIVASGGVVAALALSGGEASRAVVGADAAVVAPVATVEVVVPPDAAPPVEAVAPVDAAPAAGAAPSRPRVEQPARDPAAGLTRDQLAERVQTLRGEWRASTDGGDLRAARAAAERAIPFARRLGSTEPQEIVMVLSCRLGDERAARAAFADLPRGTPNARFHQEDLVRLCRSHGMELGDLLE